MDDSSGPGSMAISVSHGGGGGWWMSWHIVWHSVTGAKLVTKVYTNTFQPESSSGQILAKSNKRNAKSRRHRRNIGKELLISVIDK